MVLIGSQAIKALYPDFNREPKDTDYAVKDKMTSVKGTEYLLNPIICDHVAYTTGKLTGDDLATLKASHLMWDISWDKHMYDLQFLLKKDCKIIPYLFYDLYEYWNKIHGLNKRSDLKMSKEDFFTNAINYGTEEHDEIHRIINSIPIYTKILKGEVELDEDKWKLLSFDDKLDLVREEVMVMSYERYKNLHYSIGYLRMLKKFIISHAPKWMLIFVLENYLELNKPKLNYYKLIENGINNKIINIK